jgi:hypothetical protein
MSSGLSPNLYSGCRKQVPFIRGFGQTIQVVIDNPEKTRRATVIGALFFQTLYLTRPGLYFMLLWFIVDSFGNRFESFENQREIS